MRRILICVGCVFSLLGCGDLQDPGSSPPPSPLRQALVSCVMPQARATDADLGDPVVYRNPDPSEVCAIASASIEACSRSDMDYVRDLYGQSIARAEVEPGQTVYRLVAMSERVGPSNVDVMVIDEQGQLLEGVTVIWGWPGTEVEGRVEANGVVGFAMAPSAYLSDCGAPGPHHIRVKANPDRAELPSDQVNGIGMLGGTEHRHLDLVFQRTQHATQDNPQPDMGQGSDMGEDPGQAGNQDMATGQEMGPSQADMDTAQPDADPSTDPQTPAQDERTNVEIGGSSCSLSAGHNPNPASPPLALLLLGALLAGVARPTRRQRQANR